ncbi:hypothetical protein BGX38DRAFT_411592 [Terfezia claveryi]|nr:hypothetical protein BGX38DRAFT_411592 [Terfezia claveryi]
MLEMSEFACSGCLNSHVLASDATFVTSFTTTRSTILTRHPTYRRCLLCTVYNNRSFQHIQMHTYIYTYRYTPLHTYIHTYSHTYVHILLIR